MKVKSVSAFWRDTAETLRVGVIDAWIFFPILVWMLHVKIWTTVLLITLVAASIGARFFGYSVPRATLALRARLAGKIVRRGLIVGRKRLNCHFDKDGI